MKYRTLLASICLTIVCMASSANASTLYTMEIADAPPMSLVETTEWLAEYAPGILEDIEAIRKLSPRMHEEILIIASEEVAMAEEFRELAPKEFDGFLEIAGLEVRSELLALHYQNAKTAKEKTRIKSELQSMAEKIFDAHLTEHNKMVEEIEAELKELKQTGKVRAKNRDRIIERRIEELTTPGYADLEWW